MICVTPLRRKQGSCDQQEGPLPFVVLLLLGVPERNNGKGEMTRSTLKIILRMTRTTVVGLRPYIHFPDTPPFRTVKMAISATSYKINVKRQKYKGRDHALLMCLPGIGSASSARHAGALKVSAKYCVSCTTNSRANSMTETE